MVKGTQAKNGVRVRAVVSLHVNGANVQSNQGFVCVHKYFSPIQNNENQFYRLSEATIGDGGLSTMLGILNDRDGACDDKAPPTNRDSGVGDVGLLYGLPPGVRRPR